MSNELITNINCAFCNRLAKLCENHTRTFANSIQEFVSYSYLSYDCECGESWTTNESDTISVSRYRLKIRSSKRKKSINKCIKHPI